MSTIKDLSRCLLEPSDPKALSVAAHPELAYGCSLATHGVGTQGNIPTHPSSEDSGLLCCVSPTQARGKPRSCSSVPVQIGKLRLQSQVWHSLVQNVGLSPGEVICRLMQRFRTCADRPFSPLHTHTNTHVGGGVTVTPALRRACYHEWEHRVLQ